MDFDSSGLIPKGGSELLGGQRQHRLLGSEMARFLILEKQPRGHYYGHSRGSARGKPKWNVKTELWSSGKDWPGVRDFPIRVLIRNVLVSLGIPTYCQHGLMSNFKSEFQKYGQIAELQLLLLKTKLH